MSRNWVIGIIVTLIIIAITCGVVFGIVLPRSQTVVVDVSPLCKEQTIGALNDQLLGGGRFYKWIRNIEEGKTISIFWEADGNVHVWVLTQTQYDYFDLWGTTARYEAFKSGRSGTLTYKVTNTDTYYLIIQNPSWFETIKIYSAEVKLFWYEHGPVTPHPFSFFVSKSASAAILH